MTNLNQLSLLGEEQGTPLFSQPEAPAAVVGKVGTPFISKSWSDADKTPEQWRDDLIKMLGSETLDPKFDKFDLGNFVNHDVVFLRPVDKFFFADPGYTPEEYKDYSGLVKIFGNFATRSYAFRAFTNDPAIYEPIEKAVRANQATAAYQEMLSQMTDK